jgi:predicted transcriptional regulator
MKQNITLALDKELLKKVKVLAAKRDTSVTHLLTNELDRIVSEEDHYESSKKRSLARLKKGFHLGGRILAQREELHERR